MPRSTYKKRPPSDRPGFFGGLFLVLLWPVKFIIKQLVMLVIVAAIGYGALAIYVAQNPEKQENLEHLTILVEKFRLLAGGVLHEAGYEESAADLGYSPVVMDVNTIPRDIVVEFCNMAKDTVRGVADEPIEPVELQANDFVPDTLIPVMDALEGTPYVEKARERLAVRNVGPRGEGAIEFLERIMQKDDAAVRTAAIESLRRIGTPEARAILIKYEGE